MEGRTYALSVSSLRTARGVAEFIHEDAERRNPLGSALRHDYERMLDIVENDPEIKCLLLAGSGGSFCAGGDIREMRSRIESGDPSNHSPDATRQRLETASRWLSRLRNLNAIVIACVDGPAYGGGFSLALHADFILASPRADFCMSFIRLGLTPDFGAVYCLSRLVGLAAARDILLTGRRLDAQSAHTMGMVHAVLTQETLMKRAHTMADMICRGSAQALSMTKAMLNRGLESDYAASASMESYAQGISMSTPYHKRAIEAFLGREPLQYEWDRDWPARPQAE
ncbi:enoyl-CoA hydratase/isomerase family protein [Candidimonas nitroreducens]|uniref:Enoyl-CoA hydratase n=1 Tax=Candidimonas nitroreducens TaxID=683354 RepID=A0A225MKK3_9BURK|nr:enoyl-CoA hydratase/isomerase family protein [Candidimonas nitroreducens]OWT61774.1 enoyl-CoA hydratase [Candidimonas nitroreducens]